MVTKDDDCNLFQEAMDKGHQAHLRFSLDEAEKFFMEAAAFAPNDPSPIWNLSRVLYERGDYAGAELKVQEILRLLEGVVDGESKKPVCYLNIIFYQLYRRDILAARQTLQHLDDLNSNDASRLIHWLRQEEELYMSMPDMSKQRNLILDRLPRYKADILDNVRDLSTVGHEILIPTPIASARPGTAANIMICGLGDSGYLFSTLLALDSTQDKTQTQQAHITVIDINPATMARMLIIFQLMVLHQRNSRNPQTDTGPHTLSPRFAIMLSYLFSSPLVPITATKYLGLALDYLIGEIEAGKTKFCGLVYLPLATRHEVYSTLKRWKCQLAAPSPRGSLTARILGQKESRFDKPLHVPGGGIRLQQDAFKRLGALVPWSEDHARQFPDRGFIEAVRMYFEMPENDHTSLDMRKYLDINWRLNPTLVDFELKGAQRSFSVNFRPLAWPNPFAPSPHQCYFDPTEVLGTFIKVAPPETFQSSLGECFFDALIHILTRIDAARINLSGKVLVEAIGGEVTDVMERIRYDALSHRQSTAVGAPDANPIKFPKVYDGIHMSSLPDYTGGMFSIAYYARPLLREHDDDLSTRSRLRFRISLNYPLFKSHDYYMAEYLAMTGEDILQRLSRPEFLHKFFSYLLKIVLPYPRPNSGYWPTPGRWQVNSPLNLTAILRFAEHMVVHVGYSSKWVSYALISVSSGVINTTARSPQGLTASPEEVETIHPLQQFSLVPWRAEFTTLLGIWRPLLPFGIFIPRSRPDQGLPRLREISHCSIAFPTLFGRTVGNVSRKSKHYMLIFLNAEAMGVQDVEGSLYRLLMTPEDGCEDSPLGLQIRGGGVHIITTFTFETYKTTARFWMRDDVVAEVTSGDWTVYLWRTDTWRKASEGVDAMTLVPGEHWLDNA
ncbi:hypothetical protein PspLS_05886 [Pyricularia sp. CBS 133598]|nr:hypothetical protein PspLS_05886 [Pyricularia sp. CBS 133598]